jgi:hypothetical protein
MSLGILILHYNTPKFTADLCQTIPEAIVIDNGSDPGKEYQGPNRCIRFPENLHFTRGWNEAVKALYNEFTAFWLLNNDIKITRADITRVNEIVNTRPDVMLFTPAYNCWLYWAQKQKTNDLREVPLIEFTGPVIRKDLYEKIGFWDERFKRGWGVEFDYCYKMRQAGIKIYVDDKSAFFHIGQQTTDFMPGYYKEAIKELKEGTNEIYGHDWKNTIFSGVDLDYNYNFKHTAQGNTTAVYCTIFGDYDDLKPVPPQTNQNVDYICITDNENLKAPGWRIVKVDYPSPKLNPRMRAKFFKILYWELPELDQYYNTIFIDASIKIKSEKFVNTALAGLIDIKLFKHPERNNITDEMLRAGTLVKYNDEPMQIQAEAYVSQGLPPGNLYAGGIIARKNKPITRSLMAAWWHENIKYSCQDQLSLPYIFWKFNHQPQVFNENQAKNDLFNIIWHDDNRPALPQPAAKISTFFSIILNVPNTPSSLSPEKIINTLQSQTFKSYEIIIIDNAIPTQAPILDYIYSLDQPNIKIIRAQRYQLPQKAIEMALPYCQGKAVVPIDLAAKITPDTLQTEYEKIQQNPQKYPAPAIITLKI